MIEITNEVDYEIDRAESATLVGHVLTDMHVTTSVELNILFIDSKLTEDLHTRWLDLPNPTDVMGLPMDELRPGTASCPTPVGTLGDTYVCPQVVERQVKGAGHTIAEGMLMLTTHGMLRLLGYNHTEGDEKKEMFTLQHILLLAFLATQ